MRAGLLAAAAVVALTPAPAAAAKGACGDAGTRVVHADGRVLVLAGRPGTERACDTRTGATAALDPEGGNASRFGRFHVAGRWLLYQQRRAAGPRLLLRDTRSGATTPVADGATGAAALVPGGTVAVVAGGQLVRVAADGDRRVLSSAAGITAVSGALDAQRRAVFTWVDAAGPHTTVPVPPAPAAPAPAATPAPSPCDAPVVFARGRVRVTRAADVFTACDGESAARTDLGFAAPVDAAGPFLTYKRFTGTSGSFSFRRVDVRSGAVRELQDGGFRSSVSPVAQLPDGTVAWVSFFSGGGGSSYELRLWPFDAAAPITVAGGAACPSCDPAAGADAASFALAGDGTTYWRRGDGTVDTRPPG